MGVREVPQNRGAEVEKYQKATGSPKESPYCYSGQYWSVLTEYGAATPILRTGLASASYYAARRKGNETLVDLPRVGDLIYWKFSKTPFGHVERVVAVGKAGWVTTVAFNTTSGTRGDQRDGGGVYYRKRNVAHPLGRMRLLGCVGSSAITS